VLSQWYSLQSEITQYLQTKHIMSKVLKIGIMRREQFQKRLLDAAAGRIKINSDDPKIWFSSTKSLSKTLSDNNPTRSE